MWSLSCLGPLHVLSSFRSCCRETGKAPPPQRLHAKPHSHGLGFHPPRCVKLFNWAQLGVRMHFQFHQCFELNWTTSLHDLYVSGLLPGCGTSNHLSFEEGPDLQSSDVCWCLGYHSSQWDCIVTWSQFILQSRHHRAIHNIHPDPSGSVTSSSSGLWRDLILNGETSIPRRRLSRSLLTARSWLSLLTCPKC